MINTLPFWKLTDKFPSQYDSESATAIEMVSKVYAKINELVKDYNEHSEELDKAFNDFRDLIANENEIFRVGMRQEFQDFIDRIELEIKRQHQILDEAVIFMKDNLSESVLGTFHKMMEEGAITVAVNYDPTNEALSIAVGGDV